jgi:hypothetical protein
LVTVIVAPGTTAPESSWTVPRTLPVVVCGAALAGKRRREVARTSARLVFFMEDLPRSNLSRGEGFDDPVQL